MAASAPFYLSVIGSLLALLLFSGLYAVRLNNQIERLHWQLALSQLLRTFEHDRALNAGPAAVTQQLEDLASLKGAEDRLQKLQEQLTQILATYNAPRVEQPVPSEACETEAPPKDVALTAPFLRGAVGLTLISLVAAGVYVWHNLDQLECIAPPNFMRYFGISEDSRSASQILAYKVDLWFSTNKYAKVLALLFFTLMLVGLGSFALFAVSNASLYEAVWSSLAGVGIDWTFAQDFHRASAFTALAGRLVSMLISIGGLLITALLLGIVSEIISEKVDDMKKGTADVLESGHTLILGWSDEMMPVLRQLCLANESIGGAPIVILSEKEKEEMEMEIIRNEVHRRGTQIICRSGNPLLKLDLDKVSVATARSIIVLADQQSPDQSDARVLRIILSLMAFNTNGDGLQVGHVVAELCDMDNEPLVKLVGGDLVQTVVSHDIIGRLMIQCAQQPGLAAVYDELMGFEGCEFYLQPWPELTGRTFGEALFSFSDAVPIGIKKASTGKIVINAADDTVLEQDDALLVIAEDENTYALTATAQVVDPGQRPEIQENRCKEKILFLGWRRDMDDMIAVLDTFVAEGSELWLYNEVPVENREKLLVDGGLDPEKDLKNLVLRYKEDNLVGDLITRKKLEALNPASFSSILVLADEAASGEDIADADSRNLATLLLLRDIMHQSKPTRFSSGGSASLEHLRQLVMDQSTTVIVSEILDARTRNLIMQLSISEFVMSNEIVSMALSMVAESADVNRVLQELFSESGAELYIRPVNWYIHKGEELSFFELMRRCRQCKEIPIGYQTVGRAQTIINPHNKNEKNLSFETLDSIVVLAD